MKTPLPSSSSSSVLRKARLSPYLFTLIAFMVFVTVLYGEDFMCLFGQLQLNPDRPFSRTEKKREKLPFAVGRTEEGCDIFSRRWVRDELNRPLYEESERPSIQPQLTCQEHGRPDKEYQYWRWQPHRCSLPRVLCYLNAGDTMREEDDVRGRLVESGSYSMVCLLHRLIAEHAKSMETFDSLTIFTSKEYNATIEFYWAPFLLESYSDNAVIHRISGRIVRKGSINRHGRNWKGVDIMVFNTYLWWITGLKLKILKGSFEVDDKEIVEVTTEDAYRMAMRSMLRGVRKNMDPKKTRVFFTRMSPTHAKGIDWGSEEGKNCYNETTLIEDPKYWGSDSRKSIMKVIGEVFSQSKFPISFLKITQLSSYRKDAHTSIYKKQWSPLTEEQLANPVSYADCVHWSLPGLQDTWNELLFAKLFYPSPHETMLKIKLIFPQK